MPLPALNERSMSIPLPPARAAWRNRLYQIIFEKRNDRSPCPLCAKMRRAMLCDLCNELGCNKLALGHHREDALETFLMSLIYEGRIHTFHPKTYMSRANITVIRPSAAPWKSLNNCSFSANRSS